MKQVLAPVHVFLFYVALSIKVLKAQHKGVYEPIL